MAPPISSDDVQLFNRICRFGAVANREGQIGAERKRDPGSAPISFVPNGTEERFFTAREYSRKGFTSFAVRRHLARPQGRVLSCRGLSVASKSRSRRVPDHRGLHCLEEAVKALFAPEVRDRVSAIPFVARAEMPSLYAKNDIFVFPSLVEGMPLTLLEAMATAMPVVTTNVCGMADVVENGVNGVLIPPADANALAEAIERLCHSAELRKRLGGKRGKRCGSTPGM